MTGGLTPGWMWYDGQEVLNNARTLAYVRASGTLDGRISNVSTLSGCTEAAIVPGLDPWTGPQTEWAPPIYTSPIFDPAPWFEGGNPHSADFLGYWVEEITGMDGAHHTRESTARGSRLGGSAFGARKDPGRTIALTLLLIAKSQQGMVHGIRYLEDRLLGPLCDVTCREAPVYMRTCCPPADDYNYGFWELRNVALVDGPRWSDVPLERSGAYIQRVELQMMAGDPCRYGPSSELIPLTDVAVAASCNLHTRICGTNPTSRLWTFVEAPPMGAVALRATLLAADDADAPGVRLYTVPAPDQTAISDCFGLPITRSVQTRGVAQGNGLYIDSGRQAIDFLPQRDMFRAVTGYEYLAFTGARIIDWPLVFTERSLIVAEVAGAGCQSSSVQIRLESYQLEGCAAIYACSAVSTFDYGVLASI